MPARVRWTGKTAARGYGWPHQQQRARWQPEVDAGRAYCHAVICLKPDRWIRPGTPWHLGHTADRTAWTGPEHALCNESDGGRRGGLTRRTRWPATGRPSRIVTSRDW